MNDSDDIRSTVELGELVSALTSDWNEALEVLAEKQVALAKAQEDLNDEQRVQDARTERIREATEALLSRFSSPAKQEATGQIHITAPYPEELDKRVRESLSKYPLPRWGP